MGAIINAHCFFVKVVQTSGYSIDFIIVAVRQYQASSVRMRLVRMAHAHESALDRRYCSSAFIDPVGLVKIPKALRAAVGGNRSMGSFNCVSSLYREMSPGVEAMDL
jgi:hypothetical protein